MARHPLSLPFSGAAMREARERAGLNLISLARLCAAHGREVHASTLGKIEAELHRPSPELLRALTTALNVEVDALLDQSRAVEPTK